MNIYIDVTNDLKKREMATFSDYLQKAETVTKLDEYRNEGGKHGFYD